MNDSCVYSTLKRIEERDNITIKDALDVFQDLCKDIKIRTGNTIEKQPAGDIDELVTGICSVARTIARIYQQNEEIFAEQQYQARWEKANKKFEVTRTNIEQLEEEISKWHRIEEEVLLQEQKQQEKLQEIQELEKDCRIKKQGLQELSSKEQKLKTEIVETDKEIPLRRQQVAQIQNQLRQAMEQKEELEQKRQTVESKFASIQSELGILDVQQKIQKQTLQEKQQEVEAIIANLQERKNQFELLSRKELQQKEKSEEINLQTEQCKKNIHNLQENILPNLYDILEKSQSELKKLQMDKQELVERIGEIQNETKKIHCNIEDEQANLTAEMKMLENGKNQCLEQKAQLREVIETETKTAAQLAATKKEISEHEKNIEQIKQEAESYRNEILPALESRLQELVKEQEKQHKQRRELNEKIAGMESEGQKLLADYEARKAALEQEHGKTMNSEQKLEELLMRRRAEQKEELKKQKVKIEAVQKEIEERQSKLQQLKVEGRELSEKKAQLEQTVMDAAKKYEAQERDCQRLQKDNEKILEGIRNIKEKYWVSYQQQKKRKLW